MEGLPFHWHPVVLVGCLGLGLILWRAAPTRRARVHAVIASTSLLVAFAWPLGDLASHVSLSAMTVQRLIVMVVSAPSIWISVPEPVVASWTRPAVLDRLGSLLAHPAVSLVTATVLGTVTLLTPVVDAAAKNAWWHAVVSLGVLATGLVWWLPVTRHVPGSRRLSETARAAYVFVGSIVVTSLSIVWIFASRPLYPALTGQRAILHVSALADQQIAGFVAKIGAYAPLWAIAFLIFSRAERAGRAMEERPLYVVDVERHIERAKRRRRGPLVD